MYKHSLYAVAAMAIVLFLAACDHVQQAGDRFGLTQSRPVTITLLHMNDLHSQLDPFTPPQEPSQGGVARVKTLTDAIRADKGSENVIALFGGDAFQGTMFYNAWKGSAEVMALNHLGFDAIALGNHEFDSGPEQLVRALRGEPIAIAGEEYPTEAAKFIVLGTNIDATALPELDGLMVKRAIITKNGMRYGLLGVTTETTANVSSPGDKVKFTDYAISVQKEADALMAEGVNKIFLLSHAGTDVDRMMIPQLSGIDVVVGGHDHALFGDAQALRAMGLEKQAEQVIAPYPDILKDRDGNNVLLVSAYEKGRWLGNIDITFDAEGIIQDEAWLATPIFVRGCDVEQQNGTVVETDCTRQAAGPDRDMLALIEKYRRPLDEVANERVGEATVHFAGRHSAASNVYWMGDLTAYILLANTTDDNAVAAVMNRGGVRADLPKGIIRYADINTVLPFDNTVAVIELTGTELVQAMDIAVTGAGGKSYGARPHVAGMSLHYCKTDICHNALLPGGRVTQLTIDGKPVDTQAFYRIATIDYLAKGGDFYSVFKEACEKAGRYCKDKGILLRDAVANWFRNHSPVVPVAAGEVVAH